MKVKGEVKYMKKLLIVILLFLIPLTSCSDNTLNDIPSDDIKDIPVSEPEIPFNIDINTEKIHSITTEIELKIGFSAISSQNGKATLSVEADGFDITNANGDTFANTYSFSYEDFCTANYPNIKTPSNPQGIRYYEPLTLRYIPSKEISEPTGSIKISLTATLDGLSLCESDTVYYAIQGENIVFSFESVE